MWRTFRLLGRQSTECAHNGVHRRPCIRPGKGSRESAELVATSYAVESGREKEAGCRSEPNAAAFSSGASITLRDTRDLLKMTDTGRLSTLTIDPPERQDSLDDDSIYREEGVRISMTEVIIDGYTIPTQIRQDDLRREKTIGRGACSFVERSRHKRTGELFAVKVFNLYDRATRSQLLKEIKLLSKVDCRALVTFYGAFHRDGNIGMVLEFMDRGSLHDVVIERFDIPEHVLAAMTYQILWGLAYLHHDGRLHRDIKPSNILINSRGEVKLSDFGIAAQLDDKQGLAETMVGTFKYMSPERLLGEPYGPTSDLWSLGIVLIELWTKEYPFENVDTPIELVQTLEECSTSELIDLAAFPTSLAEFVRHCLDMRPENRIPADILIDSPWFEEVNLVREDTDTFANAVEVVRHWMNDLQKEYDALYGSTMTDDRLVSTLNSDSESDGEGALELPATPLPDHDSQQVAP